MNSNSSGCYVIDANYNIVNVNATAKALYPQLKKGEKCYQCLMGLDAPCGPCPVANNVKGPQTYTDPIRKISEVVDAVEMDIDGHGRCHMLVFATVENDAVFAATLPTDAEGLKNLALVKALTVDYYDVIAVDLRDGSMTLYRHNGKAVVSGSDYRKLTSYEEGIREYIANYVCPEDREMVQEKTSLEFYKEALKHSESIVVHYRVFWQNEIHYFYRKVVRIGEADSFENIVVGIACEDDEIKSRQEQHTLEQNLRKVEYSTSTGLLTKEAFFIHGDKLLATYPEMDFDFCILRLENLGSINHQYGRIAGDRTVQQVGETLRRYETDTTCIAYFGDGMYGCLTPTAPTEELHRLIALFREQVMTSSGIKNLVMKWSNYKKVNREVAVEETFEKISFALSTVRAKMGQEYVEFDQAMLDQLEWEQSVENNFRKALADGEFVAWYQPKYAVHTQQIIGAEALVRWRKPNGEMVPPGKFIPVLEDCGLINLLDAEIFRQACRMQKAIAEQGLREIPISVNLSRASIFTNDIARHYLEIAESYGVDPHRIPIEITESAAVRAARIREFADSLISKGFALHMDDFGAGYSSLASLQIIPFESIKLDKSLVDFIGKRNGESLLKHTIAFAKESGMSIVAEGVETMEQYMFLKIAGCDAIQGYYFSKPIPEEALLEALKK